MAMKILIVSKEGDGLGIAHRLAMEGHDVSVWIREERYRRALTGIITHVDDPKRSAADSDLIVSDTVGLASMAQDYGRTPVLGFNAVVDKIELDRALGMDMFRRAGVDIPETLHFDSPSAVTLPSPWGLGWVIKPCGNKSTCKTLVVKDEELWEHAISQTPDCPLIVQRIVDGMEVSTEGWFNGRDFIRPFNHTFEEKRFLNGGLGCNTGCMGNVVIGSDGNRLTRATVERFAPFLRMIDYRGPFDINCIVNERGAYALEATGRMGYDAVEALSELLDESMGDLLYSTAVGVKREMDLSGGYGVAVRVTIPPWPVRLPDQKDYGEPVLGIDEPHVFLCDVYKEEGRFLTAGGDGVLLKAVARGPSLSLAKKRVYRTADAIKVGAKQYRTDIGDRVEGELRDLRAMGWLK